MNLQPLSKIGTVGLILLFGLGLFAAPIRAASTGAEVFGWRQVNESGFNDPMNTTISTLDVFDGQLYAGTWNVNGAQVLRANEDWNWTQFTPTFSADTSAIIDAESFDGWLYIGTAPLADTGVGELWRTDGNTWQQITSDGFGDSNNYDLAALAVFSGKLYAATGNMVTGLEMWCSASGDPGSWEQVNADGFNGTPTWPETTMEVFDGQLFVGISRITGNYTGGIAELWRSEDGKTWTPVFTDGLGDPNNSNLTAMATFQGKFYISLRNTVTGGQVWRSGNGTDWTPVFQDGLGETANSRPYGLIEFEDHLYLIFSYITGKSAEVWWSADGSTWRPILKGGWGDENNRLADYFDKAAVEFKDSLYIGTGNEVDGGEIWQKLHSVYLPVISRGGGLCSTAPNLISPANGSSLNTIAPLYQWDSGSNPLADSLRLQVALDSGFEQIEMSLYSSRHQGFGYFRFSHNLEPTTTYYWRTFLMCENIQGPYSEVWFFTTGSGGVILPPPSLVSPPDGGNTSSTTVTLAWSPLSGSEEYLVHWREVGTSGYTYTWTTETQETLGWLDSGMAYEWWVSARNDYAIGEDSQTWHFTTPASLSIPDLQLQNPVPIYELYSDGGEYIYQKQDR
ncbi:MAG: hypothetical protein A2Z49_04215 [Chloroflexi bacterium RBG_19FT_COMBO_56_12]|nr:MAG: hypothetical protein A2Z49_04215 [Chloroflexi bacterium RBG_19FT_COMBO_56_12]